MAKMTRKLANALDVASSDIDKAQKAIFACAPSSNVPFRECLALASLELQRAYSDAIAARDALEAKALAEGRAWRSDNSRVLFYNR